MTHADPTITALAIGTLIAAHFAADFPLQSDHQATHKHLATPHGRWACAAHAATHALTALLALIGMATLTDLDLHPLALAVGIALNAGSHYWIDRRWTLRGLIVATEPLLKKVSFYDNGGAFHIDMAWHLAWIVPAALIIASPPLLALQLTGGTALVLLTCALASRIARRREHHNN